MVWLLGMAIERMCTQSEAHWSCCFCEGCTRKSGWLHCASGVMGALATMLHIVGLFANPMHASPNYRENWLSNYR
jgi:hypothetical protein